LAGKAEVGARAVSSHLWEVAAMGRQRENEEDQKGSAAGGKNSSFPKTVTTIRCVVSRGGLATARRNVSPGFEWLEMSKTAELNREEAQSVWGSKRGNLTNAIRSSPSHLSTGKKREGAALHEEEARGAGGTSRGSAWQLLNFTSAR